MDLPVFQADGKIAPVPQRVVAGFPVRDRLGLLEFAEKEVDLPRIDLLGLSSREDLAAEPRDLRLQLGDALVLAGELRLELGVFGQD